MAKNYLQHDYFSRSTPVLLKIRSEYGMAGLGIYWCLVEKIHECDGQLDYDVELLAFELGTDVEHITKIVEQAFVVVNGMITAQWIDDNLTQRKAVSQKNSNAGKVSGESRRANSRLNKLKESAQQVFNRKGTDVEQDKIIEDKIIEDKIIEDKIIEDKIIQPKIIQPNITNSKNTVDVFSANFKPKTALQLALETINNKK
jgi:hypothetical protein